MSEPVPLWEGGQVRRQVDAAKAAEEGYLVIDLGEAWTPYIFTERANPKEESKPNAYRSTYLALARGAFPDDHHGERARQDQYLELYGIAPTLRLLRQRLAAMQARGCDSIDRQAVQDFQGFLAYKHNDVARAQSRRYQVLTRVLEEALGPAALTELAAIDTRQLDDKNRRRLAEYQELAPEARVIEAVQARLQCEGYAADKGKMTPGGLDWSTHQALAEFERRHRIYGWGFIGKDTLKALRHSSLELERRALVRVLTERAMHAAGVVEDGSAIDAKGKPATYRRRDGNVVPVPNLEAAIRREVVRAFALDTPAKAALWLENIARGQPRQWVAIRAPELPEYYAGDMELEVVIDRGDVWYEFPFDAEGKARPQPVERRPRLVLLARYAGQSIPLVRYGTTIGGWRSEKVEGEIMWKYKNSPPGPRVWSQIVAAPVWLPPDGTPARSLLKRVPGQSGAAAYKPDFHEVGPSYASAYGLVAAYHKKFRKREDGTLVIGGDEGIRTHGSVDYMSIMRRHSHGCHRLHNHLAVRMMSFILAHRPHKRSGMQKISTARTLVHEGHVYQLPIKHGGYVFQLQRPVHVNVLQGRIRGSRGVPVAAALPRYNEDVGAYVHPDAGAVAIDRHGRMQSVPWPADASVPDPTLAQTAPQDALQTPAAKAKAPNSP